MPNVTRKPPRAAADDYFGTRRQKILARQQQINRYPGMHEYALDDLYVHHHDPRFYNQFEHNVQGAGSFNLNRNHNLRHTTHCLNNLTHNYPHRSHLSYADPNLTALNDYPSRTRKLVENRMFIKIYRYIID